MRIGAYLLLVAALAAGPAGSLPLLGDGHCPLHGRDASATGSPGAIEPGGHAHGATARTSVSDHCSGAAVAATTPAEDESSSSECCPLCDLACCGTASGPAGLVLAPSSASVALTAGEPLASGDSAPGTGFTPFRPQPRGPPLC